MVSCPQELKALVVRVVDWRRDVSISGLKLQGQEERVDAILQKIAAVQPETFHVGSLPHVPQLSLPRSFISGNARTQAPYPAKACRRIFPQKFGDELRQRRVARGKDYCVGTKMGSIVGDHCRFAKGYGTASLELDLSIRNELGSTDVQVRTRPSRQIVRGVPISWLGWSVSNLHFDS